MSLSNWQGSKMDVKSVILSLIKNFSDEVSKLSDEELAKLQSGSYELSIKVVKKKSISVNRAELENDRINEVLSSLKQCDSRKKGEQLLTDYFRSKAELEYFARSIDVAISKKDNMTHIRGKIVEATIGALLRSNAILGQETNAYEMDVDSRDETFTDQKDTKEVKKDS